MLHCQFDVVALHVEGCQPCQNALEQLDGSTDELVDQLASLATVIGGHDEAEEPWAEAVGAILLRSGRSDRRIAADVRARGPWALRLLNGVRAARPFRAAVGIGGRLVWLCVSGLGSAARARGRTQGAAGGQLGVAGRGAAAIARSLQRGPAATCPSIVSLYETDQTEDNVWYLVCEYIDATEGLKDGPENRASSQHCRRADADACCNTPHEQGVVHPRHQTVEHHFDATPAAGLTSRILAWPNVTRARRP